MTIEFMRLYNAKTAVEDAQGELRSIEDALAKLNEALERLSSLARAERRLMATGGGGQYEYVKYSLFNYTVEIHLMPPAAEQYRVYRYLRDRLETARRALKGLLDTLGKLGDDSRRLTLVGVVVEDGRVRVLLIP